MDKGLSVVASKGLPKSLADIAFSTMAYDDEVYFNADYTQYSMVPIEGYMKWSDIMKSKAMAGFKFNRATFQMEIDTATPLNFDMLQRILCNKDRNALVDETQHFEENFEKYGPVFLDKKRKPVTVFIASLMRSGNTYTRKMFEQVTGVCTGSNFPNNTSWDAALLIMGFKGQQHVDDQVWGQKTHHPYMYPFGPLPQSASKAIVIARNPLDVIVSLFQFSLTGTQNKTCSNDFPVEFKSMWEWFVKFCCKIWAQFSEYWINVQKNQEAPVYFVRFEDLIGNKKTTLNKIFELVLGVDNVDGTYAQKRINKVLESESSGLSYKPRSGKVNANEKYFSPEQLKYVKRHCR
jgi:hypothetical protein